MTAKVLASIIAFAAVAFGFFALGYVVGNSMGDAATFRNCAYGGRSEMVSGGSIKCSVIRREDEPLIPMPPQNPHTPAKPPQPIGFERREQG